MFSKLCVYLGPSTGSSHASSLPRRKTVTNIWSELFDRIYVVSLPASLDRRVRVAQHLDANCISDFEWHDGVSPDHPDVKQAYEDGVVHRYPPCFRCGKKACGRDDCNNVLLPVQVAVFTTYMSLFKKIAARGERALVLEDDVRLHDNWHSMLPELKKKISAGAVPFAAESRCLLRLGWALGGDHDQPGPMRVEDTLRMSNPCFGITAAFAAKAVEKFSGFYHTADIYLHRDLPEPGEAFTVFPPIASELSWSTGEAPSLIHPKEIRVEYLERLGDRVAADAERARVAANRVHMFHREILVTGHPRTGTGYAASLLQQLGFDVGHEKAGDDGLSSWMFAADAQDYPYAQDSVAASRQTLHWDLLLHVVRDPATAVASIMRDNLWAPPSYEFRRTHILSQTGLDLDLLADNFERAVLSLICWSRMILAMKPDFWFRLEDAHEALPRFLVLRGHIDATAVPKLDTKAVNADKAYKGERKPKPEIRDEDWSKLSSEAKAGLKWYCYRFGYPLPGTLGAQNATGIAPPAEAVQGLGQQFLTPSGWERSRKEQRPVRADGRPLPWFTYGAIEFLSRVVDGGMRVFEYGAGYSTLWWERAALVHSVDHDPEWVAELKPKLGPNVQLTLMKRGSSASPSAEPVLARYLDRPRRTEWDYDPERVVRRGLEDESFLAYAASVRESGLRYDVIVIDGMARRLCTAFAVDCLTESGFIVFDNSNRSDYDAAYDILFEAGFFQIPFWGLVPGANFLTCTSVFTRRTNRLPDARFKANSFCLPEY